MLLHRYFGSHAVETLQDAKLKTARISSFNDSFEFLYFSRGEVTAPQMRQFVDARISDPVLLFDVIKANHQSANPLSDAEMKARINEAQPSLTEDGVKAWPKIVKQTELTMGRRRHIIDQELRAVCFCAPDRVRKSDEILLWSHYANKHQGVRIGFNFPDGIREPFEIREITYQKSRVEVVWSLGDDETTLEALERSATIKCSVWEYEREFRLFTKTTHCEPREITHPNSTTTLEHFLHFRREWVVQVDFGVFCPESIVKELGKVLAADYPKVIPRRAECHESEYAFEYKPIGTR
jgi:hypothetical protein